MLKVLISNADLEQNSRYCDFLANDKDFEIISTSSGNATLNKYLYVEPDIFVLDSDFKDLNYLDIINRLSTIVNERKKCNTLITTNNKEDLFYLQNIAKIYKAFSKPVVLETLIDTINLMKKEITVEELTIQEINALFLMIGLGLGSNGVHYLSSAIVQCYYQPSLLNSLDTILNLIAYQYNVKPESVRESMRSTLERLNKNTITFTNNPLLKLLDTERNITPKYFLDIITTYFQIKKKKK